MSFKMAKKDLEFALTLGSKALAARSQEELVYRAVRIKTFGGDKPHVGFYTNGGYNAIMTVGYEISAFNGEHLDVLVECQKLLDVIAKSTVDEIKIAQLDEENIQVRANGDNKIRFMPGNMIAEFPKFDPKACIGKMPVKNFANICKLTLPFATEDVHRAPMIGLCIDRNNIYSTDETKGMTLKNIGLEITEQLNFNPIVLEMVKMFNADEEIEFYLSGVSGAHESTHLTLLISGYNLHILKYQSVFPSESLDIVNENCLTKNLSKVTLPRASTLQTLNRIGVFADENDLLSITPFENKVNLEVVNAKTGEASVEVLDAKVSIVEPQLVGKKLYVSLENFKVILNTLFGEEIPLAMSDSYTFVSISDEDFMCWMATKNIV